MTIQEKVHNFPLESGVYIMHNSQGTIIYIGKAKSLRKRVSQYFLPGRDVKTQALVSHIADIEYIITSTEYEALILENNLIKMHKPRYNIDLKDDKTYQMLKITAEDYPVVIKTRRRRDDGGVYFGPFPKGQELDLYYKFIENTFNFRRCRNFAYNKHICLYYHIGKCKGPCEGKCSKEEYATEIKKIRSFLEGGNSAFIHSLEGELKLAQSKEDFERAKEIYDTLNAIRKLTTGQSVGNQQSTKDIDYIALYHLDSYICIEIMQYRGGNLLGANSYRVMSFGLDDDILSSFITQYYNKEADLPDIIFLSFEIEKEMLEQYFATNLKGVKISYPETAHDFRITELALYNAKDNLTKYLRKKKKLGKTAADNLKTRQNDVKAKGGEDLEQDFDEAEQDDFEQSDGISDDSIVLNFNEQDDIPVTFGNMKAHKAAIIKILKTVQGVGEQKATRIANSFDNISELFSSTAEELSKKGGVSLTVATNILKRLGI